MSLPSASVEPKGFFAQHLARPRLNQHRTTLFQLRKRLPQLPRFEHLGQSTQTPLHRHAIAVTNTLGRRLKPIFDLVLLLGKLHWMQ
jgi:hypothetical protein